MIDSADMINLMKYKNPPISNSLFCGNNCGLYQTCILHGGGQMSKNIWQSKDTLLLQFMSFKTSDRIETYFVYYMIGLSNKRQFFFVQSTNQ